MKYILDTNICIFWLKGHVKVKDHINSHAPDQITTTIVTACELHYGAAKSARPTENWKVVEELLQKIGVAPLTLSAAQTFGIIKSALEQHGQGLDDADLLIAAIALSEGAVLITDNEKHFRRVPDLQIENWTK